MKQNFNFKTFYINIKKDIDKARKIISDIEDSMYGHSVRDEMDELRLEYTLIDIKIKLLFAIEYLGLHEFLDNFKTGFAEHERNLKKLSLIPEIDVFYSPPLDFMEKYVSAIRSHIEMNEDNRIESSIAVLERILKGTPKYISDSNIKPQNEKDVRHAIYKMLIHVFPHTVREIHIPKVFKTYKPDLGIRDLKCAIEYKFADSEDEAKKSIGGIFEDIKGYEGSDDWKNFYAVIYMTDQFFTQAQVEAEFAISKVECKWKPILVYGKGKRVKKKR